MGPDDVFKVSTPAPNVDGSIPSPWRVSDRDAMRAVLTEHGYDNARAYVEGDPQAGSPTCLWVGLRDNRDADEHSAKLVALESMLVGLGFKVRAVTNGRRRIGIRRTA